MALLELVAGGCASDEADSLRRASLAQGCLVNTDCKAPLVCAFRACHVECVEQRDCPSGELCVATDKPFKVCMFADEQKCTYHSQCPDGFKCVAAKCRPECKSAKDCVPDQLCVEQSCAVSSDVGPNNTLVGDDPPDAGLGKPCLYKSDCDAPLVCLAGACLPECKGDLDCASGKCNAGVCEVADGGGGPGACANGSKDLTETAIDCGGTCGACAGQPCTKPSDCASHVCSSQKCAAPSCSDGLQNGTESDIDCGGTSCPKCPAPKGCWAASDCLEGKCTAGLCITPGCTDGTKSGNETDVDCGGGQCPACTDGKACVASADCSSGACVGKSCKPAGPATWAQAMVGTPRVASDPTGNLVAAGSFITGQDIAGVPVSSAGGDDVFIAKLTPAGATKWVKRTGGTAADKLEEVAVDSSGAVFVVGTTANGASFAKPLTCPTYGMFLLKHSSTAGDEQWSRCVSTPSGTGGEIWAVAVDPADDVYVGGRFYGTLDFGGTQLFDAGWQGFLAKYSGTTGSLVWAKELSTTAVSNGAPVRGLVATSSDVLAVGEFVGTLDLGGKQLVSISNATDVYVARFSTGSGAVQEAKRFGDSSADTGRDITLDGPTAVLFTGAFVGQVDFGKGPLTSQGTNDAYLVKLDATTLATTWAKSFGTSADDRGVSVSVNAKSEIALVAEIGGAIDFGGGPVLYVGQTDIGLARFDAAGNHLYSKAWGQIAIDAPSSVVWVGSAVGLAGKYNGATIDLGTGPLPSAKSAFFAHLLP